MDVKLGEIIGRDGGFFVEAGANDGFTQSNTYWLERFRSWRGVLVEPIPELAAECREERPDAHVVQAALVPFDYPDPTVTLMYGDLMSVVQGVRGGELEDMAWAEFGIAHGWSDPREVRAPALTLTSILETVGAPEIDLLSLDLEGYEPNALGGLDFSRYAPRWLLVEVTDMCAGRERVEAILGDRYVAYTELSPGDVLYRRR